MTNIQQEKKYKNYLFVLNGEVVWRHAVEDSPAGEMLNAILSSNPVVVPIDDDQVGVVQYGWLWDGTSFFPPEEN